MRIQENRHGRRDYTKMYVVIPKRLVEARRWSGNTKLYLSRNAREKFALLAARRFVDDLDTGLVESCTNKKGYGNYVIYKLIIPQGIVRELEIKKGDTADVDPFKGGVLITVHSAPTRNI